MSQEQTWPFPFLDPIRKHAFDFITARIASESPKNDGKQTPMKGHPVFVAQHATANLLQKVYPEVAWNRNRQKTDR